MKKMSKIFSVLIRCVIKFFNYFNTTKYMKMYTKYLQKQGIQIEDYDGVGYIDPTAEIDGADCSLISIGKNVTMSKHVILLTHDFSIWNALIYKYPELKKQRIRFLKRIDIGNNVFTGANSIVLPGTTIEENVIIGSASVVKGKLQRNTVYAGNPAKPICTIEEFLYNHEKKQDFQIFK